MRQVDLARPRLKGLHQVALITHVGGGAVRGAVRGAVLGTVGQALVALGGAAVACRESEGILGNLRESYGIRGTLCRLQGGAAERGLSEMARLWCRIWDLASDRVQHAFGWDS